MNKEFTPCPFCGAKPNVGSYPDHQNGDQLYYVQCSNTHCPMDVCTKSVPDVLDAINMWETRYKEVPA